MAKNIHEAQIELTAKTTSLQSGLAAAEKRMKDLSVEVLKLKQRNKDLNNQVKKTVTTNKKLISTNKNLSVSMKQIALRANSVRGGYLALTGASALLVKNLLDVSVRFDNMRLSMIAAAGSIEAGGRQMTTAITIAQEFGLELESTAKAYTRLMVASRGSRIEGEKTEEIFKSIAQAARVFGLGNEELEGTLKAVEQMMSKGVVQMEELKNQLGDRLPGALGLAARSMGITRAALFKLVETGKLASDEFLPKFAEELNRSTAASAELVKNSPAAAFNRMENSIKLLETTIAQSGVLDFLANVASGIAVVVDRLAPLEKKSADGLNIELGDAILELEDVEHRLALVEKSNRRRSATRKASLRSERDELKAHIEKIKSLLGKGEIFELPKLPALSQAAISGIDDVRRAAEKGLNALEVQKSKELIAYTNSSKAIRSVLDEQVANIAKTETMLAKAREAGNTKQLTDLQKRLADLRTANVSDRAELQELEKNHGIALSEIDRKIRKERLARDKEAMRDRLQVKLNEIEVLTNAEKMLGGSLFKDATGGGAFKEMRKDMELGDVKGFDFDGIGERQAAFLEASGERYLALREIINQTFRTPEQEEMRLQALAELEANYNEQSLEANQAVVDAKAAMYAQLTGLDQGYFKNLDGLAKQSKASQIAVVSSAFSQIISLSGTKSKKLLKVQATADAASTLAKSYQAAVGALADTAGPYPVRIAAFAGALAAGLGAVAKLRAAYSSAGAGTGGGGGGGSVPGGGGDAALTGATAATNTQQQDSNTTKNVTIVIEGEDTDQMSVKRVRALMDQIAEQQKDGVSLIQVG